MIKIKSFSLFLSVLILCSNLSAQSLKENNITLSKNKSTNNFPLVSQNKAATIFYDKADAIVVGKVAEALKTDVFDVTGVSPSIKLQNQKLTEYPIIIGTLGQSKLIDQLQAEKKLETSIDGKWESFGISILDKPFSGVKKALVVYGSDRRGTAYGALEISRMIGVSPFKWWQMFPQSIKMKYISPQVEPLSVHQM